MSEDKAPDNQATKLKLGKSLAEALTPKPAPEPDQKLLTAIKERLPDLEKLLWLMNIDYEDGLYRFYYQSFKVYGLQDDTLRAVAIFQDIGQTIDKPLCVWFEEIVANGTGHEWERPHNDNWLPHTRPIVETFLHARYFVEMMVKYGRKMEQATTLLDSGWAAILTLYNQR